MPISDESLTLAIDALSKISERVGYLIARGEAKPAEAAAKRRRETTAALVDLIREQVSRSFDRGVESGRTAQR